MNTAPLSLLRDFSDRLSPMVVKELRHGLRTRVFTSILTFFQFGMILIVGSGVLGVDMEVVNNLFWGISLLALLAILPLRGFSTLSGESQSGTMDMLTLTSISSFRIIWGKWSALFSQTLLLACSLLPYMVARYHFGGVEIVREGIALTVAVLASALASAAYVAFSSQRSLILKLFLTAGIFASLLPVTIFIFVMINGHSGDEVLREFLSLSGPEQLGIVGGILLMVFYAIFTFLAMGASRIASVSENHSTQKRLIHLGFLTLLTLTGWALCFHPEDDAVFWAFIPSLILTLLIGMDVLTEEMPRFPSVVQSLAGRSALAARMGRFVYPGWASGVLFYLLLVLMNMSILGVFISQQPWDRWDEVLMFFVCVLTSVSVPVSLRINSTNLFANWWVVHIGLGIVGIMLSLFISIGRAHGLGFLGVITPVTGLFGSMDNYQHDDAIITTTAIFGGCWLLAAVVMAIRECQIYTVLEIEFRALSSTTAPRDP